MIPLTLLLVFGVLFAAFLTADVLVALWIHSDARRRGGDNAVWWAVGSFVTFPLGLIAYLVDRPAGRLGVCPFCGNNAPETETRCVFCGRSLPPQDAGQRTPSK